MENCKSMVFWGKLKVEGGKVINEFVLIFILEEGKNVEIKKL